MKIYTVILAAGEGKRMRSRKPKVLHKIGQVPMINNTLLLAKELNSEKVIVVTGHKAPEVESWVMENYPEVHFVRQETQLGTGHAVKIAEKSLPQNEALLLILYGDTPFVNTATINKMVEEKNNGANIVVLGFKEEKSNSYGKLIQSQTGYLQKIVEHKDANSQEQKHTLCNSGILLGERDRIFMLLRKLKSDNVQNELYLTDIVENGNDIGLKTGVTLCSSEEAMGVNSMSELAKAENIFQEKIREKMLEQGVTLIAPETVYFSHDTKIGDGSIIEPNVIFGKGVTLDQDVTIRAFSYLEDCKVSSGATVGPFARIRPGSEIGKNARVGNFVEIKASTLGDETKVNHLAYVGDAVLGEKVNFGAGSIICNYDGVKKHQTEIGDNAFIGSNSSLVAPIKIGKQTMVGSGTVVTKNVPDNDLALSRTRQTNKKNFGKKMMQNLKSKK